MATRTVLSRDAARNLREGLYTDGELQGVILELAEVQARLDKNFKWVIIILAVLFAAAGVLYFSKPGVEFLSVLSSLGGLAGALLIALFYIHFRYTTPVKRAFLRNLRKGYPDQYDHYAYLFHSYVEEAKNN